MSLSIIIPAFNEEKQIKKTIYSVLRLKKKISKIEVLIIDDQSTDMTFQAVKEIKKSKGTIKIFKNKKKGLGSAIQSGIEKSKYKYLCIFMADMSDDLNDLKRYYDLISKNNLDAVFGTRFANESNVYNYPKFKLILNRIFNNFVRLVFFSDYNDFTNAFKIYKRSSLLNLLPIISENFNVFLEIPLKIISREYRYKIIPIKWKNRKIGKSNFKIRELSSMYIFTLIYCVIEKILLNKKK